MKLSMAVMVVAALVVCSGIMVESRALLSIGKVIDYLEGKYCPPPPGSDDAAPAPAFSEEPFVSPAPEVYEPPAPGYDEPAAPVDAASPPAPPSYDTPPAPTGGY